ncbi:hypothetical protein F2Q70_00013737 [Brassica cretica]|uniref:Uncharacterized protein n=1 Tax=Brassica cretica TaxID=69181 RepID=A0A8S9MF76_BRACR|nr:hypothetical protein F2Q70_00013737 [Brassica cretica]
MTIGCRNRTSKIRYELRRTDAGRFLSGRVAEDYRELVSSRGRLRLVGDLFASRNAGKNNLGFFGIRVPKDQDGAAYCFCKCGRV